MERAVEEGCGGDRGQRGTGAKRRTAGRGEAGERGEGIGHGRGQGRGQEGNGGRRPQGKGKADCTYPKAGSLPYVKRIYLSCLAVIWLPSRA